MINKNEKKYCLYFHINSFTEEVFYIGIGNKKRPNEKIQRSTIWHRTVKKYGYKVRIIHTGLCWQEVCDLEIEYIKKFGRRDKGTGILINQTDGGDGAVGQIGPWKGKRRPDLSERNKGNKYGAGRDGKALMTDEIKAKISKAHMGKVAHNKGKPGKKWSEEQRQKRIKLFTGRKLSEETKRKISIAHKGRKKSPEHIEKVRVANIGRKVSQSTRKKLSKVFSDRWTDAGYKEKMSTILKERWKDPEYKNNIIESRKKTCRTRNAA